jgi:hypothetical protein
VAERVQVHVAAISRLLSSLSRHPHHATKFRTKSMPKTSKRDFFFLPTILPTFIGIAFICCYSFDHNAHITFVDFRCSFLISANTPATNVPRIVGFFSIRFRFGSFVAETLLFFPLLNQIDSLSLYRFSLLLQSRL